MHYGLRTIMIHFTLDHDDEPIGENIKTKQKYEEVT